ncbi:hypothetical protein TNIN_307871 [Trichonephila inaurata madagascariensis]|uniref:RNase H type-1 domain-containing protein n=1 Tax=Trichonephila inaurata madagascariensis TaxID=2747483 RepID=A0A8X6X4A6_9ARAC|nr:hypothetical protein TNIN_307871 [Trichonephila inaurata madagascariensis]
MQVTEFSPKFLLSMSLCGEVLHLTVKLLQYAQFCPRCSATWEKFTSDSRDALLAIASDTNLITQDILACRQHLENLASLEKTIVLQWVPAHFGVPCNEKVDFLVKRVL